MSFLKIGDRAAGAIKSGGTTRRAAKMVVVDIDHPDIEQFVDWKVVEEQKVAALVAGSKACNHHLNAVLRAVHRSELSGEDRFDPKKNTDLRRAARAARQAGVPDNYVQRTLQLGRQGVREVDLTALGCCESGRRVRDDRGLDLEPFLLEEALVDTELQCAVGEQPDGRDLQRGGPAARRAGVGAR